MENGIDITSSICRDWDEASSSFYRSGTRSDSDSGGKNLDPLVNFLAHLLKHEHGVRFIKYDSNNLSIFSSAVSGKLLDKRKDT